MEAQKTMVMDKDLIDVKGWTIPKGTTVFILKENKLKNPMTKKTEHWFNVKIDNGTGDLSLMPETAFKIEK